MPEYPQPKIRPQLPVAPTPVVGEPAYAELHVTSNFSFLRGGSHPEELAAQAAALGYAAVAITDINTMAGIVRAHEAAKECKVPLVVGCHIQVGQGNKEVRKKGNEGGGSLLSSIPYSLVSFPLSILLYPTTRAAYGKICRMLTYGKRRAAKGQCHLTLQDVIDHNADSLAVVLPPILLTEEFGETLAALRAVFDDDRLSLAAACPYDGTDTARLAQLAALARTHGVPLVATNDVHYHAPERQALQDVLTCIRLGCTLEQAGFALHANAERHMKGGTEMSRLFRDHPHAIARTLEIARRAAGFSLDQLKYEYPAEVCPPGKTPMEHLTDRTWQGAKERYPAGVPDSVRARIEHEFTLIRELDYPAYFLTVDDIVTFARSRGILCQGRGAAANSAVCYCLGITAVDPARVDLLVERFISKERNEPPDIDIDFEHERREEVIQYLYNKYGRERAALTCEVISYRRRSAVREVGKALGLSLDCVDKLAKSGDWWEDGVIDAPRLRELGLSPHDPTIQRLVHLATELLGFPRHLSQHVGGFVISRGPLCESVPIENAAMPDRTIIEWDKDDIDAMGMLKVDVLGLGMLTCIRKAIDFVNGWGAGNEERGEKGNKEMRKKGNEGGCCSSLVSSIDVDGGVDSFSSLETIHGTQRTSEAREDLSRSDCVAKGDGFGAGDISGDEADAHGRTFRAYQSDAQGGGIRSFQHRGGQCAPDTSGLSEISAHGERIAGGIVDAGRAGDQYEDDAAIAGPNGSTGGGEPSAAIPDHESAEKERRRIIGAGEGNKEIRNEGNEDSTSLISSFPHSLISFPLQFHTIPPEDPRVYDMLCRADSVGVFQVESRAQMTMLPRLKPRCYYDLVIEVAIVRPGPIQGGMVHPYLRRRNAEEPIVYPNDRIKEVLGRTLGVPLFQEQAMRLVMVAAGFTAGEADQLRRAMAAWKRKGNLIHKFGEKIITGMMANGYTHAHALQVVEQIKGFSEYGFPESHAASFALLVYVSSWLKLHHPAAFAAALINSQPMGFYAPAQIIRDAREHGVTVLPVDVNASGWDCRLEGMRKKGNEEMRDDTPALRLGMRLVTGMREAEARKIEAWIATHGPAKSITNLWRATGTRVATLRTLAAADAFTSLGLDRQAALWEVMRLRDDALPMFDGTEEDQPAADLPKVAPYTQVIYDYAATGMSLKAHPISFVRRQLTRAAVTPAEQLADERRWPQGKTIAVAGLVLVRQRPATAHGILFMTIEDEAGIANLIIKPDIYDRFRRAIRHSVSVVAWGKVERQGQVVHVLVRRVEDLADVVNERPALKPASRDFR